MNRERAKEILSAFREGIDSPDSPEFAEAFNFLEFDGELAEWFFNDKQFDQEFGKKLRSSDPPEGLKDRILDAIDEKIVSDKLDELSGCGSKKICISLPRISFIHWLGVGTVFLMLGLIYFSFSSSARVTNSTDFVYRVQEHFVELSPSSMEYFNPDINNVKSYIISHSNLCGETLGDVAFLNNVQGIGCLTGKMNDLSYAFFSFLHQGGVYHLYVFDKGDISIPSVGLSPSLIQTNAFTYAIWNDGPHLYSLISRLPKDRLWSQMFQASFDKNY